MCSEYHSEKGTQNQAPKNRHIHSNFRNDTNSGKGLDTWHRHNEIQLRKVFLSGRQNQGFQIELAPFKVVHVGPDDAELFW